jgi:response regulator RpfG family c-di-GMP phosphodiesterase/DNA-binding CsgD family transcriptional regulator
MMTDPSHTSDADSGVRLAEVMASLSIATDLGMGQSMEYALTTSIVATRLGEAAGLAESDLRDAYYESLLRYIGCNADTYWLSSIVGDELALRAEIASIDMADTRRIVNLIMRHIRRASAGSGLVSILQAMAHGISQLSGFNQEFFPGHCEVARRLAGRLGFPESFVETAGEIYARWDGKGVPALKGEQIAPAMLVASLAQDAVTFYRLGGIDAAVAMARRRSGGAHSPRLVEIFCRDAKRLLAGLDDEPAWETALALEPGTRLTLSEVELDNACEVMADYGDIKSPWFLDHSRRVAALAAASAERCGLPKSDVRTIRRAALLHDIGKVGISAGIWGKRSPLAEREWELVRLHPYHTERILSRSPALARLGSLAALHHERLDGSGYYRGLAGGMLSPAARVLATANLYCSLTERRSHRNAMKPEAAAEELQRECRSGRLDTAVVSAVLDAAGHRIGPKRKEVVAGLSEREVEVLRLIAAGRTMKQMASELFISVKTVDRHIQNIYTKIGVSTRAGATLFAMEKELLER